MDKEKRWFLVDEEGWVAINTDEVDDRVIRYDDKQLELDSRR